MHLAHKNGQKDLRDGQKWDEDEEEDVSNYWTVVGKEKILEVGGSTRSHSGELAVEDAVGVLCRMERGVVMTAHSATVVRRNLWRYIDSGAKSEYSDTSANEWPC